MADATCCNAVERVYRLESVLPLQTRSSNWDPSVTERVRFYGDRHTDSLQPDNVMHNSQYIFFFF